MEIYLPTKEEWQQIQNNLATMVKQIELFSETIKNIHASGEYFPEYMTLDIAAKYLRCPIGRIKSMVYKQKILSTHHIDLTTTVYIARKDMDELRLRVKTFKEMELLKAK